MTRGKRLTAFWGGMASGLLLAAVVLALMLYFGLRQTYVVRINTNSLSEALTGSGHNLLEDFLPQYLDSFKETIPELVGARTENQFNDAELSLGGIAFALPEEFIQQLELNYQESVVGSMHELLDSFSISELSDELGEEISYAIVGALYAQYNQTAMDLDLLGGLIKVPVRVELVDLPGEEDIKLIFAPASKEGDY